MDICFVMFLATATAAGRKTNKTVVSTPTIFDTRLIDDMGSMNPVHGMADKMWKLIGTSHDLK